MAKKMTPEDKQNAYNKAHEALLKKYNLGIAQVVDFPGRAKLPVLSRIALKIISLQGGRVSARFVDLTK